MTAEQRELLREAVDILRASRDAFRSKQVARARELIERVLALAEEG